MITPDPIPQNQTPVIVSIWKQGAVGTALIVIIGEVRTLFFTHEVYAHNPTFIFMNLFLGTPLNFLLYWPFGASISWIWRKLGNLSWIAKILVITGFLTAIEILLIFFLGKETRVLFQF